ncbi:MAG TPA: hypothetical protein PKD90_02870 [Phnomibacter sp.]|nr:hypothetical protein [Phnomibacter sp.]
MLKKLLPLIIVFILVTLVCLLGNTWLQEKGVAVEVVLAGNVLLFAASVAAFMVYASALKSKRQFSFMQRFYTGFMIKFFALVIGALLYFYFAKSINKPAIFICMAIYLVYHFLSTSAVVKRQAAS